VTEVACIVDEDVTNIDHVVDRMVFGAFYQAGQSCISVQRLYIHEKVYDTIVSKFATRASKVTPAGCLNKEKIAQERKSFR
jgi:acyl-CoA reductase-like NAD-dependent aldehyde dehydrogenase